MYNLDIKNIDLNDSNEKHQVEAFLEKFNLILDSDIECTFVAKFNDEIVGTCSSSGNVLKCFAVDGDLQGEGIASKLITHITNLLFDKGIYETFIFTKPKNITIFKGMGYYEVYSTGEVSLLEGGMANVKRYVESMLKKSGLGNGKKAALVMNCNPFTLGHRYLIETASKENDEVVVFVVEEDKSIFPFKARFQLVKKGVEGLKNVHVVPGGHYIISSNTFPSYFLKREDERLSAYTMLDAGIFGKYIAPVFNIVKRYVGTEPYCPMTNRYNAALNEILPGYGVEVRLIPRLEIDGVAVSASTVRKLIKDGEMEKVRSFVPETTYEFLVSDEANDIMDRLRK